MQFCSFNGRIIGITLHPKKYKIQCQMNALKFRAFFLHSNPATVFPMSPAIDIRTAELLNRRTAELSNNTLHSPRN